MIENGWSISSLSVPEKALAVRLRDPNDMVALLLKPWALLYESEPSLRSGLTVPFLIKVKIGRRDGKQAVTQPRLISVPAQSAMGESVHVRSGEVLSSL